MAITYEYIAKATATGSSAILAEFTSIPQTYTDLMVWIEGSAPESGNYSVLSYQYNSNSSSVYSSGGLYGLGSIGAKGGTTATSNGTGGGFGYLGGSGTPANGTAFMYIINYSTTNERGTIRQAGTGINSDQYYIQTGVDNYADTSAVITSIKIYSAAPQNWTSNSKAWLYGIKKA